ncbi:MAG: hypothetical protein GWN01_01840 [Nitrosopumilaceae archaeon]|nr:hypothetical protein [Nitrosopumilaceae archaeon]NIT99714.1 hypothetical protein [Nitrosopumilaceae archaeon]NIU88575.1 hypothetical protein [Nitrosopumilaceae archaeon]NIV64849.1 hypothetical protein [Nitrosopumilaceae archaeon]NIX60317.1 hypothetical protein [Nitrosopumilaceae archaeon]
MSSKTKNEGKNFQYRLLFPTFGFPIDHLTLVQKMIELNYKFSQPTSQSTFSAQRDNVLIQINLKDILIYFRSPEINKLISSINEIIGILETHCEFDMKKIDAHEFNGVYALPSNGNSRKKISNLLSDSNKANKILNIFDKKYLFNTIKLVNGDEFGNDYVSIVVEPMLTRPNSYFYANVLIRNPNFSTVESFMADIDQKLHGLINKL